MDRAFFLTLTLGTVVTFAACSSSSSGGGDGGLTEGGADAATADGGNNKDSGVAMDSGNAPNGLAWTSGTRLRAIVDVADSAKLFVGWHDKALDVDCTYDLAVDSMTRCLPINGDAVYDDAACTNAVAAVATSAVATVKYVPEPRGPFSCGKARDFYAIGAAYVPAAVYTKGADGTCNASSIDPNATYSHLGAKVLPSSFVAETDVMDPRGTTVSAIQWVGDDKSRQDGTLIDLGRKGDACGSRANKAGSYYCVPTRVAFLENFFSDAACGTGAAYYPTGQQLTCIRPPTAILDATLTVMDLSFYEPGAKVTVPVHQGTPANCKLYSNPADVADYYSPGAALPLAKLPALTVKEQGAGRIQQHTLVTDKGTLATILDFYDSQKSTVCRQATTTDGVTRCVPVADKAVYSDINLFLDATCKQPIFQRYVTNPAPAAGGWAHASTDTLRIAAITIGAKLATPGALYALSGGVCNPSAVDGATEYYATTVVPPTDFVQITRTVE